MKRRFFSLLMVMAVFSMYAVEPAAKPTEEEEREWLASSDGEHEDDATRSRKCESFWGLKTGTLTACSVVVKNLDVEKKLKVGGDATICGNFLVKGNCVPHTIYLRSTDSINDTLNALADCSENSCPTILSLAPGTYAAGDLNVCKSLQDITIQGDTSPLAGVGFMQGGIYNDPGFNLQCQIGENTAIGRGDQYYVYRPTGETMIVTVTTDLVNNAPDFSSVEAGTKVCFVDTDGGITEFTVASTSANSITFTADISGVIGLGELTSDLGVGFVIKPNVTLTGSTVNSVTGIKNLKVRGVILNWIGAEEACNANEGLYLGGVKTKLELSNSVIQGIVRIAARESYNCQPNTVLQTAGGADTAALIFGITSEPNFVFNSVFGTFAQVLAGSSKAGSFAYGQFSASTLRVVQGARLSIDASRLYNVLNVEAAILVEDGSHINWPNGVLTGDEVSTPGNTGVIIRNSSGLSTSNSDCDDAPVTIRGFDIAITVTQNSFAAIRGATNPEFFDNNTNDLDLDGLLISNINTYGPDGLLGTLNSYLITEATL